MTFEEILDQAIVMLQRRGRLTYGALKRQFNLEDAYLEDLKAELIEGQRLAVDEDGRVLVWAGRVHVPPLTTLPTPHLGPPPATPEVQPIQALSPPAAPPSADAKRRQLTVLFCDLVESTRLASQLDPEDFRQVVRAYQATCAEVIQQFGGHIAQYLGDGLLVYFGYPLAHEDDAQRAVRAGLGMTEALGQRNTRLAREQGIRLAVRVGIHTGLVVIGAIGDHEARRRPVLMIVEDLHWVDPSTLELLSLLIEQCAQARLCLVLTTRPEFHPSWTMVAHLTALTLRRLTPAQVERVATHVAGDKALPAAVLQEMMRKTDGVPLFVEELTKTVLESGLLQVREDGYTLPGPLPPLAIPTTLHDALMARLDRLATVKVVAQLGAAIGRTFAYELIQAVAQLDAATLQGVSGQLVEAEVLAQRGLPPQATYTFRHALVQEAAYQSLLKSTRQQYHQRIAQVLEAQFPETVAAQPELMAQHYTQAGLYEQAFAAWRQAGEQALGRSAYQEAVACLEQARVSLSHLPESHTTLAQAIDLRFDLRNALLPLGEQARIFDCLREAETLAQILDDRQRLGQVSVYMTEHFSLMGDLDRAVESGQHALTLAATLGDVGLQVRANFYVGSIYDDLGDYRRVIDCLRWNVVSLEGDLIREHFGMTGLPSVLSRVYLSWSLAELGVFPEGTVRGEEGVRIAETINHPFSLIWAYAGIGKLCIDHGDVYQGIPVLERGLELCQDWHISTLFPMVASILGVADALSGRVTEALPLLEQVASKVRRGMGLGLRLLSEAYLLAGRMQDAFERAQSYTLDSFQDCKQRGHQAYALRLLGEVAAHREIPDVDQATAYYHQALALAEALGMRPLQARCHRSLGTLYAATGQRESARAALSMAIALYCAMGMTFWLPQTEATLMQVEGQDGSHT